MFLGLRENPLDAVYVPCLSMCIPHIIEDLPQNGCFSESYGELPYLTDSIHFQDAQTGEGVKEWDKMKEHLSVRIVDVCIVLIIINNWIYADDRTTIFRSE